MIPVSDPADYDEDDEAEVKEVETDDGRQVIYSTNADDENAAETDEWVVTDTAVELRDHQ
jgi:hypothetical protein